MTRILGIESSCDETAAAVVDDRSEVRSSIIASQIELHQQFGGVVPELAARLHVEAIGPVIRQSLSAAETDLGSIDAVAATYGPGLIGSLLVGFCAAKAIAWERGLPLLAVNHLEGHIRSAFIEHPEIEFPCLGLIVSGGHTSAYLCPAEGEYRPLAKTRDDAAGEAFDKVARLMGLGYPGGPVIERIARDGDERAHHFPKAQMKDGSLDFSFSGLKTAARRTVQELGLDHGATHGGRVTDAVRDLAASFQRAAVEALVRTTVRLSLRHRVRRILVTGGVACNGRLRRGFDEAAAEHELQVWFPSPKYTTDNAAMIAAAGFLHLERGQLAPAELGPRASLRL